MKWFMLAKTRPISKKIEVTAVVAMLAAFVAIVSVTIGSSSIWFDEAFGAYLIRFNFFDVAKFTSLDVHPPLYYWVLQAWTGLFGASDVALRSLSTLFAVIALVVGYILVRKAFGQRTALVVLPFVVLSPILIRYAQEARMYTMVLAIGLTATLVLYVLQTRPSKRLWVLYGILIAAGMWTHYFIALVWLGHWVWRAFQTKKQPLRQWKQAFFTREWVWTHILAVALFLPWLPWLTRQVLDVQTNGFWIPAVSPVTLPSYLSDVFLYQTAWQTAPWMTIVLGGIIALGAYLAVRTYRSMPTIQQSSYLLLVVGAIAPVGLLLLASMPPLRSTFIDRYLLTAAVLLVMVLAVAIARAPKNLQFARVALAGFLITASVVGIANVYHYGNYNTVTSQKSETKQLIQSIRDTADTKGQPIIANSPWIYYEAAQYGNATNGVYFIDKDVEYKYGSLEMLRQSSLGKITDLDAFLAKHPVIWYIGRPNDDSLVKPSDNLIELQRIAMQDSITGKPAYQAVQYRVTSAE